MEVVEANISYKCQQLSDLAAINAYRSLDW